MPGLENYPKERVSTPDTENGQVKQGNTPKPLDGPANYKPCRPGQDADDK